MSHRCRFMFCSFKYLNHVRFMSSHRKRAKLTTQSTTNQGLSFCRSLSTDRQAIRHAGISAAEQVVEVQFGDKQTQSRYPFVWLRDNCQCDACFHQQSQSRTIDLMSFDLNARPQRVSIVEDALQVEWTDGHVSMFSTGWLQERMFEKHAQNKWLTSMYRLPRKTWDAELFPSILSRYDFTAVTNSDEALYRWLFDLATHGVSVIEGAPATDSTIRQLADRVAFIRKTHYGEEFSVKAKPGTTNVAYLSSTLQIHTDLPYYHYKPGVNLLHCLVQTDSPGGANVLADALAVAKWLQSDSPDCYRTLTTAVVDWNDIGHEDENHFYSLHRAPVISLNAFGDVERINFSQPQRDSHFNESVECVQKWYAAMDKFTKALLSDRFCVTYKMKEGEILTFDNHRLVHGRSGYDDNNRERHVIGGYLDWDEIWSRIRVLKQRVTA